MKQVYQTTFGGIDAPLEEQGNCFQAAIASALDMRLEEAFDIRQYDERETVWFDRFQDWLSQFGLAVIYFTPTKDALSLTKGVHLAEVESTTLKNGETHTVVIKDGDLAFDPNPHAKEQGKLVGVYIFVPLDAGRLRLHLPSGHLDDKFTPDSDRIGREGWTIE